LLRELDLHDATIVGWSYGGATAMLAAHQEAESAGDARIGRLVLVGSAGPGIEKGGPPRGIAGRVAGAVLSWVHAVPPAGRAVQRLMSEQAYSGQPQPDWWQRSLAANMVQAHTFRAFQREGERMVEQPPPDSAGIALPILVIHGDLDRLVPIEIGRRLARNNPGAELLEIAGGSHMLPLTHAALLADRIASFSAPPPPAEPAAPLAPESSEPSAAPESWMESLVRR
jgi:pimeloyl-ACP methyl ester carboxylesterase